MNYTTRNMHQTVDRERVEKKHRRMAFYVGPVDCDTGFVWDGSEGTGAQDRSLSAKFPSETPCVQVDPEWPASRWERLGFSEENGQPSVSVTLEHTTRMGRKRKNYEHRESNFFDETSGKVKNEEGKDDFGSFVSETTAKSSNPFRWLEMVKAKSEDAADAVETVARSVIMRNLSYRKSNFFNEMSGTVENEEKNEDLCNFVLGS